jgi:hypothetical protein
MAGELIFADAVHGWLLLHDGAAAGSAPQAILRTTNAGRRWTRVEFNYLIGHPSPKSLPACDGAVAYLSFTRHASKVTWSSPREGSGSSSGCCSCRTTSFSRSYG